MNFYEQEALFQEIIEKLTALFPEGTLNVSKGNGNKASIPVQAYIQRLDEVCGSAWSWKTVGEPIFYHEENQVQVKGILKILNSEREGSGFANLIRFEDTGKIRNLKDAILSAESAALRKACDRYRMGWKDLSNYREWSDNPGVNVSTKHLQGSYSDRSCVKCGKLLTMQDEEYLTANKIKIAFCMRDIPERMIKRER